MTDVKEKAKALAMQEEQNKLALSEKFKSLGDNEADVDSSDLILPKILVMQPTSAMVREEKAKLGELRDSLSSGLIAAKEKPVEVILFNPFKTWVVFDKKAGTEKWVGTIPYTAANADLPQEEETKEQKIVRYKTQNYYVLLPSEIENGMYIPKVLSLRSTGYVTAKKIESRRAFLKQFGKPLPFQVFNLATTPKKNDRGSWYVIDPSDARDATDKELTAVKNWVDLIGRGNVKVDESDVHDASAEEAAESGDY